MIRNNKILSCAAALAVFAAAAFFLLPGNRPLLWEEDSRQMYSLTWRTVISASQPGAGTMHETLEMQGTLNFRIFGISDDKIRAGFQLSPLKVKRSGMEGKDAQEIYSRLFFADITREGVFLNFYFSNDISPEDEKGLQDIMRFFQVNVRDSLFPGWESDEYDTSGRYIAEYMNDKESIHKTKKRYAELFDKEGFAKDNETVDIKKSNCVYYYDNKTSWLKKADGDELLVFNSKNVPFLKSSMIYQLEVIHFSPDKSLAIWDDGLDTGKQIAAWDRLPKNKVSLARKSEVDRLKQKFGGKSFSEVADELFKTHAEFDANCLRALMEYLTLCPDSALNIPGYLLSKKLNSNQQITLVHALERTGTPEGQKSLSAIMNGGKFSKESRTQAAIGLGSIERPTEDALKSLWQAYENRSSGNENAGHIAATAVLSLGSLANGLGRSPSPGYRETSRGIKDKIASDLASEQDLNTKAALLYSAGNTADRDMVESITSHFNDGNPRVRSAAVTSLAYMDDNIVNEALTEKLDREENVNVRNAIVTTMYRKEATEDSVNSIIEKIPAEENDIVRGEMYRYLLKNREFPGVKEKLKGMLEKERSAEHRKIIRTAISTKKKAS